MTDREIRYCTTEDGVRIAYAAEGDGPALIMCPFFVESFSLAERMPEYREFVEGLRRGRSLVRFDLRGTGQSQRGQYKYSGESVHLDIRAVARAAGLRQFVLYGSGLSGPAAISYAATYPDDVTHLVLYSTFTRAEAVLPGAAVRGLAELARVNWDVTAQTLTDLSGRERSSDLNVRAARLVRESTTGDVVAAILTDNMGFDASDYLPRVKAPALVIQSTETQLFKAEFGREIATALPDAQLRLIEGAYNWLDPGTGTRVAALVDEFLGAPALAPESPATSAIASFRAVLFSDLVGHTEMMQRLGDARGREVLREHERITRQELTRHGGTEIKSDGDSFMASFGSLTSAVECAVALQRVFAARDGEPLAVRIGINAGEPVEDAGDLFGASVILAARVKDQAGPGDILLPEAVRHLLAGKGFQFVDRGAFAPKGFDEEVRLFAVRWHE